MKEAVLFCFFYYGTLCRFQETAIFPAISWSGVWQITNEAAVMKEAVLFCFFYYGTLCRFQETAIFPAISWSGVWQITNEAAVMKEAVLFCLKPLYSIYISLTRRNSLDSLEQAEEAPNRPRSHRSHLSSPAPDNPAPICAHLPGRPPHLPPAPPEAHQGSLRKEGLAAMQTW